MHRKDGGIVGETTVQNPPALCTMTVLGIIGTDILEHNILYHNDLLNQGLGQIYYTYDTRPNIIMWNIFDGGSNPVLIGNPFQQNTQNHMDNNVLSTAVGQSSSNFEWRNQTYTSLANYRDRAGNDKHSLFGKPRYENTQAGDFKQLSNSATFRYGAVLK